MLSPRIVQVLFTAVALLFAFTVLDRTLRQDDVIPSDARQSTYDFISHVSGHVTEKVSPWLTGSMAQHVKVNEEMYNDMLQQRADLMEDWQRRQPTDRDLFPCTQSLYFQLPFSIWDFVPASWNCPHTTRRLGRMGDGGKWLCGLERLAALPKSRKTTHQTSLRIPASQSPTHYASTPNTGLKPGHQPGCIIYSFGIQNESSFEEQLLSSTPHCQIWGYDFSVDAFGPALGAYASESIPPSSRRAHFTKAGIAGKTDTQRSGPPFYAIQDLMALNGHDHIDVVKMDIEGFEFEALRSLTEHFLGGEEGWKGEVPIAQILIEIHLDPGRIGPDEFLGWWEMLERVGFRPTWTEPNLLVTTMPILDGKPRYAEYSLLNVRDRRSAFL